MMKNGKDTIVASDIGDIALDRTGSAIGVSRLDPAKSYQDMGPLLKAVIEQSDPVAWENIKARITYTYEHLDRALSALDREEGFVSMIKKRVDAGQKLLFKPNCVAVENINPYTHLPFPGSFANTEWPFVAAVMRWFHDKANISYYQMSIGEAASGTATKAAQYTCIKKTGRPVTTEAAYEGKSDDFYGGWGFYFVRRYLAEVSDAGAKDNPLHGLEESIAGTTIAPGDTHDKLMVYDLNKISDDPSKGREVTVPDGENFTSIILHKAIVGGDPSDPEDRMRYPGCVLINLPKLKIHSQALFTNAIKNIGIGLYPMQASRKETCQWEYATPYSMIPAIKSKIPHQVWVPEMDMETLTPKKDAGGNYIVQKTGGLTGTMLDIIRAVSNQNIFMMHIVDAVEAVNRDHQGTGLGIASPEGLIVAGCDVVATDLFCARYMFSNAGLNEAESTDMDDGFGGRFPQAIPVPRYDTTAIVTETAYDCPIARDDCFAKARQLGMGTTDYYVKGWDATSNRPLASVKGRLGSVNDNTFQDIHTRTLFWDIYKLPWDLQKTFFGYLEAVDTLENKDYKQLFLNAFDETGDGSVTYEEFGKKGVQGPALFLGALYMSLRGAEDESEMFRAYYAMITAPLRGADPGWNDEQHDFNQEFFLGSVAVVAWMMSQSASEIPDAFYPDFTWGKGKWPSFSQAMNRYLHQVIYGWKFPDNIGVFSLLGSAFAFADVQQNNRQFIGPLFGAPRANAPNAYLQAVENNEMSPLDFTMYVPPGYGADGRFLHVKETTDPARMFTAEFDRGRIQWPDAKGTIAD